MTARTALLRRPMSLLSGIPWHAAMWASDPLWTPPADAAAVALWPDGSGNSRNLMQATGTKQPIYNTAVAGLNGRPGLTFDGTDDVMSTAAYTAIPQPYSVVMVAKINTVVNNAYLLSGVSAYGMYMMTGTDRLGMFAGSAFASTLVADTSPHMFHGVFAGASSKLGRDGTEQTGNAGSGQSTRVDLAAFNAVSNFSATTYGFVGIYAGNITTHSGWAALKAKIAAYYGLTVA